MPARPLKGDLEPFAAHTGNCDVVTPTERVQRNEHFDFVLVRTLLKKVLHTAKVARSFFADVSDKKNIARRLDLCCIQSSDNLQKHGKSTGIVADSRREKLRTFATNL